MTAEIVPSWVYNMADYCQMFDLQDADLKSHLLDFPAGISSFNAEMHRKGYKVCSGDKLYQLSFSRVKAISQEILKANQDYIRSHQTILKGGQGIDAILSDWEKSRALFIEDYEQGLAEKRYQFMELPKFPFAQASFDIALCSDHLFHSEEGSLEDQAAIVEELSRVAKEVRVFPLLNKKGEIAKTLGHIMLSFQEKGYGVEVREVAYHQMKGGNAMLRLWATECNVED